MDLDEIEAGATGTKKVRYQSQKNKNKSSTTNANYGEKDDANGGISAAQSSFYNDSQGS